jgi:hypothetical protein
LAASSVIDLTGPGAAVAGGRPASVLAKRLHRSGPAASPHHRLPRAEPFDAEAFVAAMGADMDMAAIMADNRQRAAKSLEAYKQRMASLTARRSTPKAIMVPKRGAAAGPGAGFGLGAEPAYTELQQVLLDDRVRVMSFYEDQRPAYVGTFSKRSTFVTGRRPLGQDHRQLNYDYDSEEEWEEADEGEDIADSDGEEEEGDNELEYNDFFRRDNDYGSDVDSDGEGVAAAIVQRREGEECIGPRFLRKAAASPRDGTPAQPLSLRLCPETRSLVGCLDKEKDVQRLRSYPAVVYSYAALASAVPVLGVKSEGKKGGKASSQSKEDDGEPEADGKPPKPQREKKAPSQPRPVFDESCVPALVAHVHGKREGLDKLVLQFQEQRPNLAKVRLPYLSLPFNYFLSDPFNLFPPTTHFRRTSRSASRIFRRARGTPRAMAESAGW